jgi:hypothetical protein
MLSYLKPRYQQSADIENTWQKSELSKPLISCHNHRFKRLNLQYIYPISYKNAKRQTLLNGFAFLENYIKNILDP